MPSIIKKFKELLKRQNVSATINSDGKLDFKDKINLPGKTTLEADSNGKVSLTENVNIGGANVNLTQTNYLRK
ncbi:2364_t:CDS:1, partial [Acaulospora morrowiae]